MTAPFLVTGASGFVGSAVVRVLLARGRRVRVLVRPESDRRNLDGLAVETARGDLRDAATVAAAVGGCESVFHVAADYRLWTRDPRGRALYESNVEGTMNVMHACAAAGVRRAVYTSSVATLGIPGDGSPGDETTPASLGDMIGHYKRSKFLAEEAVREWAMRTGFEVVIVNPSTPIGPRDAKPTPTGRLILDAAAGRVPAFVDTGLNVVHVDDVALGHVLAFERGTPDERYVLGGEDMTLERILGIVARHVGRKPPRIRLPNAAVLPVARVSEFVARVRGTGEPLATVDGVRMARKKMFFSSRKAAESLGYEARPGAEAIRAAVDWFRAHRYFDA